MISTSCDFKEFIETIKNTDYLEAIYLADKEATRAERLQFKKKGHPACDYAACMLYADTLKGFIIFLRHGIRTREIIMQDQETLSSLRRCLMERPTGRPS